MCMCVAIARESVAVLASDTSIHTPTGEGDRTEIAGLDRDRILRVPGGWVSSTGNDIGCRIGLDVLADVGLRDIDRARRALAEAYERAQDDLSIGTANGRPQVPIFFAIREGDNGATAHSFYMDGRQGILAQEADGSLVENTFSHFSFVSDAISGDEADARVADIYHSTTLAEMVRQVAVFFQTARDRDMVGPDLHLVVLAKDEDGWGSRFLAAPIPLVWGAHPDAILRAFGPPPSEATPIGHWLEQRAERIIRRIAPRRSLTPAA